MSASPLTKSSSLRALLFRLVQHFGDTTNAPAMGFQGAKASATASIAARQRGGAVWFGSGEGCLAGTHHSGPIYFGLGRPVSTTISNGIVLGFGPGVGDPTSPDYVPFDTTLASLSYVSDEFKISSTTKAIRISSTAGNAVLEGAAGAGAVVSGGAVTVSASAGQLLCSATSNAHFYNPYCGIYNYIVTGLCELKGLDTLISLTDNGSVETVKRTVSGYCAQWERRYYNGELTAAAATALAGSFTPSIANGTVRVVTNVVARRTVGGTGGFGITTSATFTVVSGTVTQVSTYTELAPAEETAAGTGVYHDNSATQIRLVAIGIDSETWRFEGYTEVFYAAAT